MRYGIAHRARYPRSGQCAVSVRAPCDTGSMTEMQDPARLRPLTREIADTASPVRRFLDDHLSVGLRGAAGRYRSGAPALAVPPGTANPGTVGTAADWLLRLLTHPAPSHALPLRGAEILDAFAGTVLTPGLMEIAGLLGMPEPNRSLSAVTFIGSVPGSTAEPELLARACWSLALFTEAFRTGPAMAGRHVFAERFQRAAPSAADLLALTPADALAQLGEFRGVFEHSLLPALAARRGTWALGPTFAGSHLMKADADLIAAGLLLELKTTSKAPALARAEVFQVVGYALLDFDDAFALDTAALFSARYDYLAQWPLPELLEQLAGGPVQLDELRAQFRGLLQAARARRTT